MVWPTPQSVNRTKKKNRRRTMNVPDNFTRIVNRKRYSVDNATLLAHDNYWDGRNFEKNGRNTFLYRTPNGAYFEVRLTCWQGERDSLSPLDKEEAMGLYEHLEEKCAEYDEAFPGVELPDA
jgi:hypothetical protein